MHETLGGACPFWTGKKVKETHLLVLIPATVRGESFTLDFLETLVKSPQRGHTTNYQLDYGSSTVQRHAGATVSSDENAYWVLMTRDVLPGSLEKKTYGEKQAFLCDVQRHQSAYMLPSVLEAATTILTHYVRCGERCCTRTYTHCKEQINNVKPILVGGFSEHNKFLTISYNRGRCTAPDDEGFALLRRL
jgi:NLR family CARD domain-containing protein 3